MLAQVILIASLPSMFCAAARLFCLQERKQWVWFAACPCAGVGGVAFST